MAKLFGTDGVRGKVGEWPIVPEFALKLGQAVGTYLAAENRKVAICKDTRISGDMLEATIVAGLNSVGVDVLLLGVLPTPAMVSLTESLGVDAAIIITASHNPYTDNGIKLLNAKGTRLSHAETDEIERLIEKDDFIFDSNRMGKVVHDNTAISKYVAKAKSVIQGDLKGLRVVLDCANGVLSNIMPEIYKDLGAGVIVIGDNPDGYNINKDCGSTHTELLSETVVKSNAQLGISVDGDGDRIIICDEKGHNLDGDQIIAYLAEVFKVKKVVSTVLSNFGLEKHFVEKGVSYSQSAVGELYVIDEMRKVGAVVGGEESGHMVLLDYAKSGDSLIVGLVIAQAVLKSGKKMSEIFPVFQPVAKKRIDVKFASLEMMDKAVADPKVLEVIKACEAALAGSGRVLVRKSGTEPKVQIWVWGEDQAIVEKLNAKIVAEVEKFTD